MNITNLENLQVSEDQGTCQRNDEEMEGFIVISCQIQRLAGAEGARSEERGGARRVVLSLGGQLTEAVYDVTFFETIAFHIRLNVLNRKMKTTQWPSGQNLRPL